MQVKSFLNTRKFHIIALSKVTHPPHIQHNIMEDIHMKKLLALSLAATMTFSLVACSSSQSDTASADGSGGSTTSSGSGVTLNVVTSYGGDDGNRGNYEAAVDSYEAATGNAIADASATSDEQWKAKVLTDFETGTEPDVLFFFSNADAEPFIQAGKVVDIATIRETYPDFATNMKDDMLAVAADGKNYAVPSSGFWENLFINKDVLAAAGVDVPDADYTWDQFLVDCQAIADAGYTPIAASLFEVPHYWFEFAVLNNGSVDTHLTLPTVENGELVMDSVAQTWVNGLNDIKDLYDMGFFPSNTLTATDAETVQLFADGDAAFLIDGSWKVGYFAGDYADSLDSYTISNVPGKGDRAASEIIGGISMGYFITEKAWSDPEKQAAAVEFVAHMTSDEVMSTFVTTEVTALVNGASPAGLNTLQQEAADANAAVTAVVGAVQDSMTQTAKGDLFANVQLIVTGQMTAEEALANALVLE